MQHTHQLGTELRSIRIEHGQSITAMAQLLEIERSYLNKIELGKIKPSEKLLDRIIVHFSIGVDKSKELKQLAGYLPLSLVFMRGKEDVDMQNSNQQVAKPGGININIDPVKTPVMYTDSAFISTNQYGIVLNFAQAVLDGQQQQVVSRIGMSFAHAKELISAMQDNIEKNER